MLTSPCHYPCRPKQEAAVLWDRPVLTSLCTEDLHDARLFGMRHARIVLLRRHVEQLRRLHEAWTKTKLSSISESETQAWHEAFAEGFELGEQEFRPELACFFGDDFRALIEDKPIHRMGDMSRPWPKLGDAECFCASGTGCKRPLSALLKHPDFRKRRRILWSDGRLKTRVSRKSLIFEMTDDEQANAPCKDVVEEVD